jgi:hypothetical protein
VNVALALAQKTTTPIGSTAAISEVIESAISSGASLPMSSPAGANKFLAPALKSSGRFRW